MAWAMKKDQVVIIEVIHDPSSLSNLQSLTTTTFQKQRKKISHQEGMKNKVPEMIRETISVEEIDSLKKDSLFLGTKDFSMDIVFSVITLVTKL
jgi:hypothetical protein